MKRAVIALDVQASLKPAEVIVQTTNRIAGKLPVLATVLVSGEEKTHAENIDWSAPKEDSCLVQTRYIFNHESYQLPLRLLKTLEKNNIEEVFVVGGNDESFLLAAGFSLFDAGIKATLIAPLCLTGQYHQHTVTMKIWENSIGPVVETLAETGIGIS